MVDAQQYHVPRGVCKKSNNSSRTPCALRPFAVVARGRLAYSKSRHLMRFHVCSASTASTGASRYDHALRFMMVGGIVSGAGQIKLHKEGDAATMRACVCVRSSTVPAGQVAAVQRLDRLLIVLRARASAARIRLPRGCTVLAPCAPPRRCELEEFRVDAAHIEILASSKGPFGSQLFTLCARTSTRGSHGRGTHAPTHVDTRVCQSRAASS